MLRLQVQQPECAQKCTLQRVSLRIEALAATGTKSGCNAHVAAVLVQCISREQARKEGLRFGVWANSVRAVFSKSALPGSSLQRWRCCVQQSHRAGVDDSCQNQG
jgi:hypothetical protein